MDPRHTAELAAAIAALAGMVARTMGAAAGAGDSAAAGASTGDSAGGGAAPQAATGDAPSAQGATQGAGDDGPLVEMGPWLADLRGVCDRLEEAQSDREQIDVPDDGGSLSEWSDFASEYGGATLYQEPGDAAGELSALRETLGLMAEALAAVAAAAAEVAARHPADRQASALAAALAWE